MIGGVIVVAVLVSGYLFVDMAGGSGNCSDTTAVALNVAPDLAPTVAELVGDSLPQDLGCADITVTALDSAAAAQGLVGGADVPDLWIPDSMAWVRKANKVLETPVELAARSVAVSPAVILSAAAGTQPPASWLEVMATPEIRLGNPVASSTAAAPVLAAVAETESSNLDPQAVSAALVPAAQAQSKHLSADALKSADGAPKVADSVQASGGMGVVTEQAAVALGPEFHAVVPASGTVFMEYPLVVSAKPEQRAAALDAAERLVGLLTSDSGGAALSAAGFRTSPDAPLDGGRGVGPVEELVIGDAAAAEQALSRWSALAVPTRGLVVIDVSGSMAASAGEGATRIALTQQAALVGEELFPGNAQLGLWAFSLDLGGPQKDYVELAPIRMLDAPSGGSTHRDALAAALGTLGSMVKGGTGLYDTVFAAYQTVLDGYDPSAVNAVIILTDGENEDPSSITRAQLMEGLARMADPARPVVLVAIGITDDADAEVLAEMAKVTGGSSYVARDPADIPTVFVKALSQRQG
ncbi:VWA domain-containing protein [Tomitella biformata]|uniref:VWA domain-containing protein n=1 Tax=Tomitella biformata TaxID=630403 RepID=UPI000685F408|nr:VWA domain-containing protein [Tomitella biformata]